MEWLIELWNEDKWYQDIYIISGILFAVTFIISAILYIPHSKVAEEVEREYASSYSKHFFISFRKNKQRELYRKAEIVAKNNNPLYFWYTLKKLSAQLALFSFGVTFWIFIGSFVYEQFDSVPETTPVEATEYYESVPIESDPVENNGVHHVAPHWVEGYERSDGTKVKGYYRGGKDGYYRSNPDGNPHNNLNR